MHAFDFILVLFLFVQAVATDVLSTEGERIIACKRLQLSWFNAGWMPAVLLFTCAWWIGLWDLHGVGSWDVGSIAFYFAMASGIYLLARLVSPRVPERDKIARPRFHSEEGRKYLHGYTILGGVTVVTNAVLRQAAGASRWPTQNLVIAPMTIVTGVAAIFINSNWMQVLALVIQIVGWIWYFAALQAALSGRPGRRCRHGCRPQRVNCATAGLSKSETICCAALLARHWHGHRLSAGQLDHLGLDDRVDHERAARHPLAVVRNGRCSGRSAGARSW
jgi:hypothetical protein